MHHGAPLRYTTRRCDGRTRSRATPGANLPARPRDDIGGAAPVGGSPPRAAANTSHGVADSVPQLRVIPGLTTSGRLSQTMSPFSSLPAPGSLRFPFPRTLRVWVPAVERCRAGPDPSDAPPGARGPVGWVCHGRGQARLPSSAAERCSIVCICVCIIYITYIRYM